MKHLDYRKINKIGGWLKEKEAKLLYDLAKNCSGKGAIVEIGSWKGKSTVCLAKGSRDNKKIKVYAIDPHKETYFHKDNKESSTLKDFNKNIKRFNLNALVIPIIKTSKEASKNFNKPIELMFIDGNHKYKYVKEDFNLWFPKVITGGIVAFHDALEPNHIGPPLFLAEILIKSNKIAFNGSADTIICIKKIKKMSFKEKIKNLLVGIKILAWRIKVFINNLF